MQSRHCGLFRLMRSSGARTARAALSLAPLTLALTVLVTASPRPLSADTAQSSTAPRSGIARGHSLLGSYLAGRIARANRDTRIAAAYYRRALEGAPNNKTILKQAFLMETAAGNWDRAGMLAEKLVAHVPDHHIARLFLGVRAFREGAFEKADEHFRQASPGPFGALTAALARSWVALARGAPIDALAVLDKLKRPERSHAYWRFHRALIADLSGRRDIARKTFSSLFRNQPRTLRVALAYACHAAHTGNGALARRILTTHIKRSDDPHPAARALLALVRKGERPDLLVHSPGAGLAEVFYGLGDALTTQGWYDFGSIYLQLSLYLEPRAPMALQALAQVYERTRKFERALEVYGRIPKDAPIALSVAIRKAIDLNQLDRTEEAKAVLMALAKTHPKEIRIWEALGNIMRARKRYGEAVTYYSRAIALIKRPVKKHWTYYYSRGVSYERLKKWPKAERDLLKALRLHPDQPLVLNYLGYSWVDQGRHLPRAMALIRKAVKLRQDDGYFVDSLGWAYYRIGRYDKAVMHLERAAELRPDDPVINDHLGDAYWRVGRLLEARYQWSMSLSLKPEPADAIKIKAKLKKGLPEKRQARIVRKRQKARNAPPKRKRTSDDWKPF